MHALPTVPPTTIDVATAAGVAAAVSLATALGVNAGVVAVLMVGAIAAVVDLRERRVPDELVLLGLIPVLVLAVLGSASLSSMALGAMAMSLPLLVIHIVAPAHLGFGDVKLAVPLGASLGAVEPMLGLVALCVASALTAFVGLTGRRRELPFAPGLVVGAGMAFALSFLTDWFLA